MSQPRPDLAFRPKRPPGRELSTPQLRALRKELLIVRADVERAELAESFIELREAVTRFSWLRFLVPGFGRTRSDSVGIGVGQLLKQYPLLSSIASLLLAKPLRTSFVSAAKPLAKWGGLALAAWEAWRVWQQIRQQRGDEAQRARRPAPNDPGVGD